MRRAILVLALLLYGKGVLAADPELILTRGKIVTVDPQFRVAEAIAVGEGRILAVGTAAEIEARRGPSTRLVDLRGRTVLPGLIDGHIHFLRGTEFWESEVRLEGITRRAEALEALRRRADAAPPGAWVITLGGWSEDQFADEPRAFSRVELDAIAPSNPVFLQVGYGRAYANSAALRGAGIALAGGEEDRDRVERDAVGEATGRLLGPRGYGPVRRAFEGARATDPAEAMRAMARTLNAVGVTAVYDPGGIGVRPSDYVPLEALTATGDFPLRVFRSLWIDTPDLAAATATAATIRATRAFRGNDGYDLVAIGEAVYSPLHDNFRQPIRPSAEELEAIRRILTATAEAGLPLHMHAIEGATVDVYLDVVEEIARTTNLRPLRWTIAHAWTLSAAQIERLRRLGMTLALQSGSSFDATRSRLGGKAGLSMPPLRLVQDSALPWGLGTDATVVGQTNPFITLGWAVTGRMPGGQVTNTAPVTREEALIAHTRGNAFMVFRENALGAIQPGMLADLVVLDRDYLTVPEEEIFRIRPVVTMVNGRLVHGTLD